MKFFIIIALSLLATQASAWYDPNVNQQTGYSGSYNNQFNQWRRDSIMIEAVDERRRQHDEDNYQLRKLNTQLEQIRLNQYRN